MKADETNSPIEDLDRLTSIGARISYKFDGIFEKDQRKTRSTYYLAKVLNTNMTILSLINGGNSDSIDVSTIYSLLRNQLALCNIYWYLIDDYTTNENLHLKLSIFEFHDTISSQVIYNSLFYAKENEEYFKQREIKQLTQIKSNSEFALLGNDCKKQIIKGNKSTILSQFEIIAKRKIELKTFKAYYKIFSSHIHSSPTAIKNITSAKVNDESEEFEILFMFIAINYISLFVADMILSVNNLWELNDISDEEKKFLTFLAEQL